MPARAYTQLVFDGEPNKRQKFALVSFPGQYEAEWRQITRQDKLPKEQRLASSCVFYPDKNSDYYGEHCKPCQCANLYKGVHKDYDSWPNGQAEFGCFWFQRWKSNVDFTEDRQVAIVVYKAGLVNETEGLGNSQRGEVAEIHKRKLPTLHVDLDEFMGHLLPLARSPQTLDGKSLDEVKDFLDCLIEGKRALKLEAMRAELQVSLTQEEQAHQQKAAKLAGVAEELRRCQEDLSASEQLIEQLKEAVNAQPPPEKWAEVKKGLEQGGLLGRPSERHQVRHVYDFLGRQWLCLLMLLVVCLCRFLPDLIKLPLVLCLFEQIKQLQEENESREEQTRQLRNALHARPSPEEWADAQEQTRRHKQRTKQLEEALQACPSPKEWADFQKQTRQHEQRIRQLQEEWADAEEQTVLTRLMRCCRETDD